MRRLLLLFVLFSLNAFGYASYSGWCEQGAVKVSLQGMTSTSTFQQSYPNLSQSASGPSVTVYLTGTTTKATIYSDNNATVLANPFPCRSTGQYLFFADNGTYDLLFAGTGISSFTRSSIQGVDPSSVADAINIKAAPCKAKGDGSTNDTVAISTCATLAMTTGKPLYWPTGIYLSCGATATGTGPFNSFGDGMFASGVNPFGGAGTCNSPMLTVTTTGAVTVHDIGWNGLRSGQTDFSANNLTITGSGSAGALSLPSSCKFYNLYIANAKSVGVQANCNNGSYTNSYSTNNYFYAVSFASSGTVASPLYSRNFVVSGIESVDESIGVGFSFFLSNISVVNSVFYKSNLSLIQTPSAYFTSSGLEFNGVPDQGCYFDGTCGTIAGSWYAMFLEGVGHFAIGKAHFSNINGSAGVLGANGSDVTLGATNTALPTNNGSVDGVVIENSTAGFPLLINTPSTTFGGSAIQWGGSITIKNTKLSGVNQCPVISGASSFTENDNVCESASNGGYTLANDQNGTFQNNVCRNCNTSGGTTYTTGTVTGSSASASITGSGTTFISGMIGGSFTSAGTVYQICARASNTAITLCTPLVTALSGSTYSIYYGGGGSHPGLTISGTSTYNIAVKANAFLNDTGNSLSIAISDTTALTPAQSLVKYDANNTCGLSGMCGAGLGLYSPIPTYTPTCSNTGATCSVVAGSTSQSGQVTVGAGTVTGGGVITFAGNGFATNGSTSVGCQLVSSKTSGVTFVFAGNSSSSYTFTTNSADIGGTSYRYTCDAPGGQADQGSYPYPYFWR